MQYHLSSGSESKIMYIEFTSNDPLAVSKFNNIIALIINYLLIELNVG